MNYELYILGLTLYELRALYTGEFYTAYWVPRVLIG
jgi:hypothetical protein